MAKKKEELHAVAPVLRVAPLGQLNVYTITEDELESLRRGSPGSIYLNFGLALTPVSIAFLITLLSTNIPSIEGKIFFIAATVVFALAGLIFIVLAGLYHQSVKSVVDRIRNRMPPPEPIPIETPASQTTKTSETPAESSNADQSRITPGSGEVV